MSRLILSSLATLALSLSFAASSKAQTLTHTPRPPIILDYKRAEMVITTQLRATGARPAKVWVWAFFVNPSEDGLQGSRSDEPIAVSVDWKGRDTVTIVARGPFHWATNSGAPRSGYGAKVYVSAVSADAVRIRPTLRDKSMKGITRVSSRP